MRRTDAVGDDVFARTSPEFLYALAEERLAVGERSEARRALAMLEHELRGRALWAGAWRVQVEALWLWEALLRGDLAGFAERLGTLRREAVLTPGAVRRIERGVESIWSGIDDEVRRRAYERVSEEVRVQDEADRDGRESRPPPPSAEYFDAGEDDPAPVPVGPTPMGPGGFFGGDDDDPFRFAVDDDAMDVGDDAGSASTGADDGDSASVVPIESARSAGRTLGRVGPEAVGVENDDWRAWLAEDAGADDVGVGEVSAADADGAVVPDDDGALVLPEDDDGALVLPEDDGAGSVAGEASAPAAGAVDGVDAADEFDGLVLDAGPLVDPFVEESAAQVAAPAAASAAAPDGAGAAGPPDAGADGAARTRDGFVDAGAGSGAAVQPDRAGGEADDTSARVDVPGVDPVVVGPQGEPLVCDYEVAGELPEIGPEADDALPVPQVEAAEVVRYGADGADEGASVEGGYDLPVLEYDLPVIEVDEADRGVEDRRVYADRATTNVDVLIQQFVDSFGRDVLADDAEAESVRNVAVAFLDMDRFDEAAVLFKQASANATWRLAACEGLVEALVRGDRAEEAEGVVRHLLQVLDPAPEERVGLDYWRGRAAEARGDRRQAVASYRAVYDFEPRYADVRERLRAVGAAVG